MLKRTISSKDQSLSVTFHMVALCPHLVGGLAAADRNIAQNQAFSISGGLAQAVGTHYQQHYDVAEIFYRGWPPYPCCPENVRLPTRLRKCSAGV